MICSPLKVSLAAKATAVADGCQHSLALLADGSVWPGGWNDTGQLGDGTTTQRNTPTTINF